MSTIRFGKSCDVEGCTVAFNDYTVGTIVYCPVCERDLCAYCQKATGHQLLREWDVDTSAELTCDPDELAQMDDDYIDSPADGWSMKEAR